MDEVLGRAVALWRYPVKSMLGEPLERCGAVPGGVDGDRVYAIYDGGDDTFASAKGVRRFGQLLTYRAQLRADGAVVVTLPDGDAVASDEPGCDARLSDALGRPVALVSHQVERPRWFSFHPPSRRAGDPHRRRGGRFVDSHDVHLLTTATLASLGGDGPENDRRFRPNILVETPADGFPEDAWIGRVLTLGSVRLEVVEACERCVMPSLRQDVLPPDPDVRRRLIARHGDCAGVLAHVVEAGTFAVGDELVASSSLTVLRI